MLSMWGTRLVCQLANKTNLKQINEEKSSANTGYHQMKNTGAIPAVDVATTIELDGSHDGSPWTQDWA